MKFADLGLSEPLLRAIADEGYETPTAIQAQAITPIAEGRDVLGCAQTGTGKTAAFALPVMMLLSKPPQGEAAQPQGEQQHAGQNGQQHGSQQHGGHQGHRHGGHHHQKAKRRPIRALVLSPTRELSHQISDSFRTYGRRLPLKSTVIYGGVGQNPQVQALRAGVDILVATPGRLLDLMDQRHVDLSRLEILVLDEADQMLDMGFIHDLRKIVARAPRVRQTLMFSATMPPAIRQLANEWLRDPLEVQVAPVSTPAERIAQSVYWVNQREKPALLVAWLNQTAAGRTLVFTRTKHGADKVVRRLIQAGISAEAIHGNKSQAMRARALARFKSAKPPVLVATDIAARGLDIDDVSHVVNYDIPEVAETYVHRIGRTARAGASGEAVSFCDREERGNLTAIERLTRNKLAAAPMTPELTAACQAREPAAGEGQRGEGQREGHRTGGHKPERAAHNHPPRQKKGKKFGKKPRPQGEAWSWQGQDNGQSNGAEAAAAQSNGGTTGQAAKPPYAGGKFSKKKPFKKRRRALTA